MVKKVVGFGVRKSIKTGSENRVPGGRFQDPPKSGFGPPIGGSGPPFWGVLDPQNGGARGSKTGSGGGRFRPQKEHILRFIDFRIIFENSNGLWPRNAKKLS